MVWAAFLGCAAAEEADAPRVMVAAHMDEVGFMLTQIQENGLFKVVPLGGWNPYVVSAQRFTLKTSTGKNYPCISSSVPHIYYEEQADKNQ